MSEIWIASLLVLWVVVLIMAFLLAGALRQLGLIALRLGDDPGVLITEVGLERGELAPPFAGPDSETGATRTFAQGSEGRRVLIFLSPSCLACRELVPGINEVMATRDERVEFLSVCRGDLESCRRFRDMNHLQSPMVVDATGDIEKAYQVSLTPLVYLLDPDGRVLIRGVANNWQQLESLLDEEGTPEAGRQWAVDGAVAEAHVEEN